VRRFLRRHLADIRDPERQTPWEALPDGAEQQQSPEIELGL
jgi:hypothetical protein